jgi:biopolymer transport protein ExbD
MIDIVFLLLIFFIITWNFARFETEIDISVPASEAAEDPNRKIGEIIVNVSRDGEIIVNSKTLSEAELLNTFGRVVKLRPDQPIILRGDRGTEYANIMRVLDICKKAGIWNVAFATNRPTVTEQP